MLNSVLTKPRSLQEMYRRYFSFANRFEFTSLLRNYIQSEEWKDKSSDGIWSLLSSISDDIGAVLTDDIVNYTRNVVDINTCRVPQMIEHARSICYNLDHIKNFFDFLPARIQCLVDIFSINPEYLIGNDKSHILSDEVIKEMLIYIRDHSNSASFTNSDVVDRLIEDPHGLLIGSTYRMFVQELFHFSIVEALKSSYSDEDGQPIVFNLLHEEIQNQDLVRSTLSQYRSWVDRFIWNEIEHPLNAYGQQISDLANSVSGGTAEDMVLPNTIGHDIQTIMNQKRISSRFNPFKVADHIYFNGINPDNGLSDDEMGLVEMVLDFHSKPKYDYSTQQFVDDESTRYAYYKELEFCEWVKMVVYIHNNLNSFNAGMSYITDSNKFIQTTNAKNEGDVLNSAQLFNNPSTNAVVRDMDGSVALNHGIILKISKFLADYVFNLQAIRENLKTIAQKHAMRGTGALLVHMVNDYLIKELPWVRDRIYEGFLKDNKGDEDNLKVLLDNPMRFAWENDGSEFRNYSNVKVIEYEDDNEYFNIEPEKDVRFTENTNARYWEKTIGMSDHDSIGAFTKKQIHDFYADTLGMGVLQRTRDDDIQDFLIDLFRIGANPIKYEDGELRNPIDDIIYDSEEKYGYTRQERMEVQTNQELRRNQERQFMEYSGNPDIVGESVYDLVNTKLFYWKNITHASHALHPFMYNLKLWNRLNNIIINGYKDYTNDDLIDLLSSKARFDELFGVYGEGRNFWKHNIMDLTGYTTRYEAAVKDEHRDDDLKTTSPLTGYDGLFYPTAAREYLDLYQSTSDFNLPSGMFINPYLANDGLAKVDKQTNELHWIGDNSDFIRGIYSIYWQLDKVDGEDTFYTRWYSHLNYTRKEYQKIAIQLWYWRDRIRELITTNYPITKYCLDIKGNSLILVQTFNDGEMDTNPYLIDLTIAQRKAEDEYNKNRNEHVAFCENEIRKPSELWIRWKSNPIALPAFDVEYDSELDGFDEFNSRYRSQTNIEMGQMQTGGVNANENFRLIINDWRSSQYRDTSDNRLPVFFDMEQSANVLVLASWKLTKIDEVDEFNNGKVVVRSAKNPFHTISIERTGVNPSEWNLEEYHGSELNGGEWNWMFDSYHYCQTSGSLLLPFYRFECSEDGDDSEFRQILHIRPYIIPAQTLKNGEYSAESKIYVLKEIDIDLNSIVELDENRCKPLFDRIMMVCRSTNLVFSPYEKDGKNMMKCAFLGTYRDADGIDAFKVGSCSAKTRYELDSRSAREISLLKDGNYRQYDYMDEKIGNDAFNSYDALDKYMFVIDIGSDMDNKTLFDNSVGRSITGAVYNILGDAGLVPHFAYQSPVRYANGDDGGISYTFGNLYLAKKDNIRFELLGLDDKDIPLAFSRMKEMVVNDTTDGCQTILNPARLAEDIYRIWCEVKDVDHMYFPNEYAQYPNEMIDFSDGDGVVEWSIPDDRRFQITVPTSVGRNATPEELPAIMARLMDEYYVSILRTEDGQIQNEKRYILPPTPVSKFMVGDSDNGGFTEIVLDRFLSASIKEDHFVRNQVVFTGTQNPFNYDENGEKIQTIPEGLQYGNSVKGLDSLMLKIEVEDMNDGVSKCLRPVVKFVKRGMGIEMDEYDSLSLSEKVHLDTMVIPAGEVTICLSFRNVDNICKFHTLNWSSNLFYDGSLTKNFKNQFKYSDFKYDARVELERTESGWVSKNGESMRLEFTEDQVRGSGEDGSLPPYWIMDEMTGQPEWYLSQRSLVESGKTVAFRNGSVKKVPGKGEYEYALHVKSMPERYLDYFYVDRGTTSFKVNEESSSFAEAMNLVPGFEIDNRLRNKLDDLNNVQILKEYSTFIHQSEDPQKVRGCGSFNPLRVNSVIKYGLERRDCSDEHHSGQFILCDGEMCEGKAIQLDNLTGRTMLELGLEDGEVDDHLKIYTNYVKVDDGDGDYHFDLYFNVQNLFNSPFEYISSVTNQANVLILPDSYLYLSGDKYSRDKDGFNVVDEDKVKSIGDGGQLTIYGQVKTYSDDVLCDVKTIPLFRYQLYNISDDKPKFLIRKTFDITNSIVLNSESKNREFRIEFCDVLVQPRETDFSVEDGEKFDVLKNDLVVVQPVKVFHDWRENDDGRISRISFDLACDTIDFDNVPELCGYVEHSTALKKSDGSPHYDRWSDSHMSLEQNSETGRWRMTLNFSDVGYNFETIYLKWRIPAGFKMLGTMDRLEGCIFSSSAINFHTECLNLDTVVKVDSRKGHVIARIPEIREMYLGLEHSTTKRMNGFVLTGLADQISNAIKESSIRNIVKNKNKQ